MTYLRYTGRAFGYMQYMSGAAAACVHWKSDPSTETESAILHRLLKTERVTILERGEKDSNMSLKVSILSLTLGDQTKNEQVYADLMSQPANTNTNTYTNTNTHTNTNTTDMTSRCTRTWCLSRHGPLSFSAEQLGFRTSMLGWGEKDKFLFSNVGSIKVRITAGDTKTDEYKKMNPLCKVQQKLDSLVRGWVGGMRGNIHLWQISNRYYSSGSLLWHQECLFSVICKDTFNKKMFENICQ